MRSTSSKHWKMGQAGYPRCPRSGLRGDGLAGFGDEGRRPERGGGNNGGVVARRNVVSPLFARARIRSRFGASGIESLLRARLRRPRPPGGGDRLPRLRRAVREAGRMRVGGEREKESPARLRADASPRQAKSVTTKAGREDGQTAEGGKRGGGRMFGAREAAIRSKPPPSVRASSPDARRPPPGGRRKRSPAPAGRAQAARPSAAPCQARRPAGAESGSEGLACRVLFLSHAA